MHMYYFYFKNSESPPTWGRLGAQGWTLESLCGTRALTPGASSASTLESQAWGVLASVRDGDTEIVTCLSWSLLHCTGEGTSFLKGLLISAFPSVCFTVLHHPC